MLPLIVLKKCVLSEIINLNSMKSIQLLLGSSKDSVKSHIKFKEKEQLNFILAFDEFENICEILPSYDSHF